MNHIEAMKQALEALVGYELVYGSDEKDREAITSLRQAVEQAEKHGPEPIDHLLAENARLWGLIYDLHKKIAPDTTQAGAGDCTDGERLCAELKAKEQAEKQEPMALETVYETIIHWDEGGGKRSRRELAKRIVDLYTTPQPQPQPCPYIRSTREGTHHCALSQREWVGLTQKDIDIAFDDTQEGGGFNEFARAIEQTLRRKNT